MRWSTVVHDHIILLNLYTKLADTHTHTHKKSFVLKNTFLAKATNYFVFI